MTAHDDDSTVITRQPLIELPCRLGEFNLDSDGAFFVPLLDASGNTVFRIPQPDGDASDEMQRAGHAKAEAIRNAINAGKF